MQNIELQKVGTLLSNLEYEIDNKVGKIITKLNYFTTDYNDIFGYINIISEYIKDERGEYYINNINALYKPLNKEVNITTESRYLFSLDAIMDYVEVLIKKDVDKKLTLSNTKYTYSNAKVKTEDDFEVTISTKNGIDVKLSVDKDEYIVKDNNSLSLYTKSKRIAARYISSYDTLAILDFRNEITQIIKYNDKEIESKITLSNMDRKKKLLINFDSYLTNIKIDDNTDIISVKYDDYGIICDDSTGDIKYSIKDENGIKYIESFHHLYNDSFDVLQVYTPKKYAYDILEYNENGIHKYTRKIYDIKEELTDINNPEVIIIQ